MASQYRFRPLRSKTQPCSEVISIHSDGRSSPPNLSEDPMLRPEDSMNIHLGKPAKKPLFDILDLLAVLCSLVCLVISIVVVTPRLSVAWSLGFEGQIVVIGLLLGIMNICLRAVAPPLFVLLEARFGRSTLQNYDAILTNSVLLSQTSLLWRGIIMAFMVLPLGLGVAYKKFTGGQSTIALTNTTLGNYGLMTPPLGLYSAMQNSVYLMTYASAHFMAASRDDSAPPPFEQLPVAYGFNTLLLDNSSAAVLDMPESESLVTAQQQLANNEFWHLSASVDATVARYNPSEAYKKNSTVWRQAFNGSLYYVNGFYQFNEYYFGLLFEKQTTSGGGRCYLGSYRKHGDYWTPAVRQKDPHDPNTQSFRSAALMFDVRRERCAGTWRIDRNNITLVDGSCTGTPTNQTSFDGQGGTPFYLEALPVLRYTLGDFATVRSQSPWRLPSFATSVAAMYWARLTWTRQHENLSCTVTPDVCYPAAVDERISSTRSTLNPRPLLYLTLLLQPALTLTAIFLAALFHSIPLGKNFGLVAILSGLDPDGLERLRGAALSGDLRKPVNVGIAVAEDDAMTAAAEKGLGAGQIRYTLDPGLIKVGRLKKGLKYG